MYGWKQECKRQQELNCEQQDLERELAALYSTLEGGADACADLTAPRGERLVLWTTKSAVKLLTPMHCLPFAARTLLLTGEVRPPQLLGAASEPLKLLSGAQRGSHIRDALTTCLLQRARGAITNKGNRTLLRCFFPPTAAVDAPAAAAPALQDRPPL